MLQLSDWPLNFLLSYAYFDEKNIIFCRNLPRDSFNLIVDSGAFTAWNSGKTITLDGYCSFLDKISFLQPFKAVQLDVFGNPQKSYENLLIMRARGYDVMPVFTRGDSLEKLEEYYQMTDYIMFGGVTIGSSNKNYVKWFCEKNKRRKAHWLGFTNINFIKHYKPESVDSSSWCSGARYGCLVLCDGFGNLKRYMRKNFIMEKSHSLKRSFEKIGIPENKINYFLKQKSWEGDSYRFDGSDWDSPSRGMVGFVTACSYVLNSFEIEKKLGTKVYLAGGNLNVNTGLFKAFNYLKNNGILK